MTATGATWRNWARTESARPYRVERPADAWAVQRAVRAAADSGLRIKPVGASHSFTGIAVAPDVQLDLADLSGVIEADAATGRVTLGAGTHLHRLPRLLEPYGLALPNMGDIDAQTIADFESRVRRPDETTRRRLRATLEAAGVVFISENGGGAGVRLKFSREEVWEVNRWEDEGGMTGEDDIP